MSLSPRPARSATAVLIGAAACWGLGTVLSKYALRGFAPTALLPTQLLVSTVVLGGFLLFSRERVRAIQRPGRIAALGVLNPGIAYAIGLVGLAAIDASFSVVIWAVEPVLIVALAAVALHERLTVTTVATLCAAMLGIALIVGVPSGGNAPIGVLLTFLAVLSCALYSILVRAMNLTDGTLSVVWLQQASALVFALLVYAVAIGVHSQPMSVTALEALAAAVGGVVYYGLAFVLYVAGLRRTDATHAGTFLTLVPVFGLVFSAVLLGERFTPVQLLGAAVVIGAMAVFALESTRRRSPAAP